jgi:hypothetical protein
MQRDLGMRVSAEKCSAFDANGSITKSGAFGGASYNSYVAGHQWVLNYSRHSQ